MTINVILRYDAWTSVEVMLFTSVYLSFLLYLLILLMLRLLFICECDNSLPFVCVWADCHACPGEPAFDDSHVGDGEA